MRRGPLLLAAALVSVRTLGTAPAHAEGTAALPALSAEALFAEGRQLMDANELDRACERFKESDRLDPAVGTLLNLARCEKKRGRTASAWLAYREAAARAHDAGETERERVARAQADALAGTLPRLRLDVPDAARTPGLELRIDGAGCPSTLWNTSLPLDPGVHTLVAAAPGFERWTVEFELTARNELDAAVPPLAPLAEPAPPRVLPPARAAHAAPAPAKSRPPDVSRGPVSSNASPWRTMGLVSTGVGAALLAAGIGLAVDAKHLDARSREGDHCDASGCDATGLDLNHRALRTASSATALSIAGATLLAGGITLTLVARTRTPARSRASSAPVLSAWLGRDVGFRATW